MRELVRALGGETGHERNQPNGAIFWVAVPFVPMHALEEVVVGTPDTGRSPTSQTTSAATGRPMPPTDVASLRVLVVEDDDFMRMCAVGALKDLGVGHIDEAADGAEGEQKLTQKGTRFSHALIDLQMPVRDGLTCVRNVRKWEAATGERVHAIAYTANGDDVGIREECLAAGFDKVANKPVPQRQLKRLLLERA